MNHLANSKWAATHGFKIKVWQIWLSAWEVVAHSRSVKNLVNLNPTGYILDIFQFCFDSFEVYSIDSPKPIGKFPEVSNFNQLFLELNPFIWNSLSRVKHALLLASYHSLKQYKPHCRSLNYKSLESWPSQFTSPTDIVCWKSKRLDYECGCIIAVLYPWYYTIVL